MIYGHTGRSSRQRHFAGLVSCLALAAYGCSTSEEGVKLNPAVQSQALAVEPERYVVTFRDAARGAAQLQAAGGHVALSIPRQAAVAAYLPDSAIKGLQQHPNVVSIERDAVRAPLAESTPFGIPMVQANLVSDAAASGNVTVCIIDSGYYASHEDLAGNLNVTTSPDIGTGDPLVDGCGHGTHVAGTVAGVGGNGTGVVGVNPSGALKLHIVKVFGDDCAWTYSSTLVKALDECRANASGKLVVSMSLGGATKSVFEESAFNSAYNAGVLSVAAAGNDGNNRKSYPASYASVISVAAIDQNKQVASFSQYNAQVEVAAPGVAVLSTVPWISDASVTTPSGTLSGSTVEFSAETTATGVSGAALDGGLCKTTIAGASGKVVHCARGDVSFNDKVQNAQSSGAVAVVISNNIEGGLTATLGAGNSSTIPAIGISQADGVTLLDAVGQSVTVVSNVTKPASGYEAWDGTSMATPHVSAVAALVWNHVPTATNAQIRSALTSTAEDLGVAGRDAYYGYGLVRAKAALDALQGSGPSCTVTQSPESSCSDATDNDCDGQTDAADSDCQGGSCTLGPLGAACTISADCCSNNCKGKTGSKTCK
jgi:subtilisin family serine protease